ncbi:MAG TPA: MarR family winged helix-turn-helix transcriptional regulator [Solirubrobacteraceae bacterium]|nr:MarR family winged helix-turn-helix transcriptional regulator [Solirubrobacteraceae bacterium]
MPVRADSSVLASDLRDVLGRLMRRLRSENRLPLTHGAVLGRLDRDGPQGTVELAGAERVRPQSMSQVLSELEAQGFVSRRADPADGRRSILDLTDAGREALFEDRGRRNGWLAQAIEDDFSASEQEILTQAARLLERLAASD